MAEMNGRVALITGAARGMGRAHALKLASQGVHVIGIDICEQIPSVRYPMAEEWQLTETGKLVEQLGSSFIPIKCDIRDFPQMSDLAASAVGEFGRLDIVVANAGISPVTADNSDPRQSFRDAIDVNLVGTFNTIHATAPHIISAGRGGSIVVVSSTQGLTGRGGMGYGGMDGYVASKHGVVGLMRTWANWLAQYNIRVNTVHPTGVMTPMVMNEAMAEMAATHSQMESALTNMLPVPMLNPEDISEAVSWLCSDDSKYVTGVALPVDAGFVAK
ncbi:mycofactocin-coupled SDR family oxidoreductase [Prescottella equi]